VFGHGNGVKHRESFDREKDARAALDERRTSVRNREYVAPAKIPTVEQAARAWLDGKKVSESKHGGPIKESSLEFWANHIDRFIVPTLGAYRLDIVDTALIEKKRDVWKELGLTGASVNKVLTTLSAIFDKQISLRNIRFNPVKLAERMARGSNEVGENDEIDLDALEVRPEQIYGPDQIPKLIQSAEPGFAQTILTTFPLTGVRHGEALALMWRDIDFDQREITIRRNWSGLYRDGDLYSLLRRQSTPSGRSTFRTSSAWRLRSGNSSVRLASGIWFSPERMAVRKTERLPGAHSMRQSRKQTRTPGRIRS
jgi:integrase